MPHLSCLKAREIISVIFHVYERGWENNLHTILDVGHLFFHVWIRAAPLVLKHVTLQIEVG
jgi:hypothetical protein